MPMFTPDFVLNWMLQGALVAAATALGLRFAGRLRADVRYRACWLAVALVLALPAVPTVLGLAASLGTPEPLPSRSVASTAPATAGTTAALVTVPLKTVPGAVRNGMAVAGAAWALWIIVHAGMLVLDLHRLRRARQRCRPVPADTLARIATGTARRLEAAGARLAYSGEIRAAAVLGWGPPIVALQPSLAAQLTDAELDQMIVHEWAHVTRGDWRATLLQHVVHALAGWQPGIWWLNRRLRLERELACDEVAMSVGGSARGYATCLTRLAALTQTPHARTLAVGALSASGLRRRVLYALAIEQHGMPWAKGLTALALPAIVVASTIGVGARPVVAVQTPARAAAPLAAVSPARAGSSVRAVSPVRGVSPLTLAVRSVVTPATIGVPERDQRAVERTAATPENVAALPEPVPPVDASSWNRALALATPVQATPVQIVPADVVLQPAPQPPLPSETLGAAALWNATSSAAAETAVTISRGSRNGAIATAGIFTRFGKRVATTVASTTTNRSN